MKSWLIVVFALLYASCQNEQGFTVHFASQPPVMDRTTPDRLVKSKWTRDDWLYSLNDSLLIPAYLSERAKGGLKSKADKNLDEMKKAMARYEILKVSIESPSRATVLALEGREGKDSLTYVMTNSGDGWLIDDCQRQCVFCGGKGKSVDYDAWERQGYEGTRPEKECEYCGGRGFKSDYY